MKMGKETTYDEAVSGIEAYIGLTETIMVLQCCVFQHGTCVWHCFVFIENKNIFGSAVYELVVKAFIS